MHEKPFLVSRIAGKLSAIYFHRIQHKWSGIDVYKLTLVFSTRGAVS